MSEHLTARNTLDFPMRSLLLVLLFSLPLVSCQKVKELAGKAKVAAGSAATGVAPGGEMDKALEALIDRNEEGVRFRKDLPFPKSLECSATSSMQFIDVRVSRKTAFGLEAGTSSSTREEAGTWKRSDNRITFSYEKATISPASMLPAAPAVPPAAAQPGAKPSPAAAPPPAKEAAPTREVAEALSGTLRFSDGNWRAERDQDFMQMVKLKELEDKFSDEVLMSRGLAPRKLWFGKTRWKEGSKLTLNGEEMAMLMVSPGMKGHLELVFEAVEAVDGHPCGRFSITGECSGYRSPDGSKAEMSITGGKAWMSLIHPLVLKQELDTVMTLMGKADGPGRAQGHVILKEYIVWKPGA